MCVGIYIGTLATALAAERTGLSPLRVGLAAMTGAIAGFVGARFYLVLLHPRAYVGRRATKSLWDSDKGGWSVLGAPLTFVPAVFALAALVGVPAAVLFDCMALGVLAGGFWVRLGCAFNGCCVGRETQSRFGVWLHDTFGHRKRRVPVQYPRDGVVGPRTRAVSLGVARRRFQQAAMPWPCWVGTASGASSSNPCASGLI